MTYKRWKEGRIKGPLCRDLDRGCVYYDKTGAVFLYMGYCSVLIDGLSYGIPSVDDKGYVFIKLENTYESPTLEAKILHLDHSFVHYGEAFLNTAPDSKHTEQTLFIQHEEKHSMLNALTEFVVPDEVLWLLPSVTCTYTDYISLEEVLHERCFLRLDRLQESHSYAACVVLENGEVFPKYPLYEVNIVQETLDDFRYRVLRKLDYIYRMNQVSSTIHTKN